MAETVAYRVTLGSGRYASRVIGTLLYGRKPNGWWTVGDAHNTAANVTFDGRGATVMAHEYNALDVFPMPRNAPCDEAILAMAQTLAGKRGAVTPLMRGQLDAEFAEAYRAANE